MLDLGRVVRHEGRACHWSQTELAVQSHTSRSFIWDFEAGKPSVEFGRVLAVLAALEPELTISAEHVGPQSPTAPAVIDLDDLLAIYWGTK